MCKYLFCCDDGGIDVATRLFLRRWAIEYWVFCAANVVVNTYLLNVMYYYVLWAYLWHVVEYITIYLVFTTDRCAHMFYIYFLILWDDTNKKIVRLLSLNVKTRSWLRTTIYMLLFRIGFMWIVLPLIMITKENP